MKNLPTWAWIVVLVLMGGILLAMAAHVIYSIYGIIRLIFS